MNAVLVTQTFPGQSGLIAGLGVRQEKHGRRTRQTPCRVNPGAIINPILRTEQGTVIGHWPAPPLQNRRARRLTHNPGRQYPARLDDCSKRTVGALPAPRHSSRRAAALSSPYRGDRCLKPFRLLLPLLCAAIASLAHAHAETSGHPHAHAAATTSKAHNHTALPATHTHRGAAAHASSAPFGADEEVTSFIADMQARHGFDGDTLRRYFASISPNAQVLRAIAPAAAPEQQRSWERYRARFVNERRTRNGLRFWRDNADTLRRAEAEFGVPAEIVCAIIGVETEYGANTGRFGVFEALATLAFHYPARSEFFRDELEAFLLMSRDAGAPVLAQQGSYAGAIGIPQFMPSSVRRHALDYDGDGRIDLAHSRADAIGSVARFLANHGWQRYAPVAAPARVSGDPTPLLAAGLKPSRSVAELARAGVTTNADSTRPAALIDLVSPDAETEYWVGFENFWVISRYNRSSFYAMAVYQLAEALRTERAEDAQRADPGTAR
ncbi:lytic murein transglycosylase B [Rhodocyclus tenuis]|uniref:Lytic murein transglycosylase B n=1 Tax=Rhodocyclus tenuis TaxID=1066 RepID=A0A6L5JUK4_RHOTE|nr:lytic murein transglycosylase B [Rhodocyclus gracilis]